MSTLFEKLLHGELPCAKVYEDEFVFAFMDAGQVNDGHVIVATKAPRETLLDCTDDEAAALMRDYAASLDISLDFQDFDAELDDLPGDYAPPSGRRRPAASSTSTPASSAT